jgi:hypothetical protein
MAPLRIFGVGLAIAAAAYMGSCVVWFLLLAPVPFEREITLAPGRQIFEFRSYANSTLLVDLEVEGALPRSDMLCALSINLSYSDEPLTCDEAKRLRLTITVRDKLQTVATFSSDGEFEGATVASNRFLKILGNFPAEQWRVYRLELNNTSDARAIANSNPILRVMVPPLYGWDLLVGAIWRGLIAAATVFLGLGIATLDARPRDTRRGQE